MSAIGTLVQTSPSLGVDAMTHLAHTLKDDVQELRTKTVDVIATLVQASPGLGEDAITHLA